VYGLNSIVVTPVLGDKAMGVNVYILDRRSARLQVGDTEEGVCFLRRFWKVTELDKARAAELAKAEMAAQAIPSPPAAIVADVTELPISGTREVVNAHLVIGWDQGRTSVTDLQWDYLPALGYAVRDGKTGTFVLHEERDGILCPIGADRAARAGLIGSDGELVRRGQPRITECRSVRALIDGYAEADCVLDGGQTERFLIAVEGGTLPDRPWFIGKKPFQINGFFSPLA
jgi:hypothetical protein